MKPYGREKYITGGTAWKKDYHLHKNGEESQELVGNDCRLSSEVLDEADYQKRSRILKEIVYE